MQPAGVPHSLLDDDDAGVFGQGRYQRVIVVVVIVINALDAARRQRTEAVDAGIMRDVNGGVLQAGAAARAVANRVYFAVDDGLLVVVTQAADVRSAGDEAVVAHGDDAMVLHHHGPHAQARAGAAHGRQEGDGHEVFVPRHGVRVFRGGGSNLAQHFRSWIWMVGFQ